MPIFRDKLHLGTKVPQMQTDDYSDQSVTKEKLSPGVVDSINSKLDTEEFNRRFTSAIQELKELVGTRDIDSAISFSSENPVMNKAIASALFKKYDMERGAELEARIRKIENRLGEEPPAPEEPIAWYIGKRDEMLTPTDIDSGHIEHLIANSTLVETGATSISYGESAMERVMYALIPEGYNIYNCKYNYGFREISILSELSVIGLALYDGVRYGVCAYNFRDPSLTDITVIMEIQKDGTINKGQ